MDKKVYNKQVLKPGLDTPYRRESDYMSQISVLNVLGTTVPFHYIYDHNLQERLAIEGTVLSVSGSRVRVCVSFLDQDKDFVVGLEGFYRVSPGLDLAGTPELSFKGSPALLPDLGEEILIVLIEGKVTGRWCLYNEYRQSLPLGNELYLE